MGAPQSVDELLPDLLIWDPVSAEQEVNITGEKFTRVTQMTPVLLTGFSVLRATSQFTLVTRRSCQLKLGTENPLRPEWWHMSLILALERKKQADLCETKARLVYIVSSRPQAYKAVQ